MFYKEGQRIDEEQSEFSFDQYCSCKLVHSRWKKKKVSKVEVAIPKRKGSESNRTERKAQNKKVYMKLIDDTSAKSLTPLLEEDIITDAKIVTD
jgi:hypothetical protein